MRLYSVNTGYFKLDGGAMFGVVPKVIWNKLNPADENNLCSWALRSLLIEDGNRLILVDNGMGDKQDAKFFGHYHMHGNDTLDGSLARHGFHRNDITDIILTHLHFDHCGGSIVRRGDSLVPAFPIDAVAVSRLMSEAARPCGKGAASARPAPARGAKKVAHHRLNLRRARLESTPIEA